MTRLEQQHPYLIRRYELLQAEEAYAPRWRRQWILRHVHAPATEFGIGTASTAAAHGLEGPPRHRCPVYPIGRFRPSRRGSHFCDCSPSISSTPRRICPSGINFRDDTAWTVASTVHSRVAGGGPDVPDREVG